MRLSRKLSLASVNVSSGRERFRQEPRAQSFSPQKPETEVFVKIRVWTFQNLYRPLIHPGHMSPLLCGLCRWNFDETPRNKASDLFCRRSIIGPRRVISTRNGAELSAVAKIINSKTELHRYLCTAVKAEFYPRNFWSWWKRGRVKCGGFRHLGRAGAKIARDAISVERNRSDPRHDLACR